MADDIRTMNAGSQVADTLQAILARRRDEARQAMLDRLAQEEQSSVHASRAAEVQRGIEASRRADEAEKRFKAGTDAEIAANRERVFQSKLGNVRPNTGSQNIQDTDLLSEMQKRGLMETRPVQGPSQEGGDLPPVTFYPGTYDQTKEDRLRQTMLDAAAQRPDIGPGLEILSAGGPAIPSMLTEYGQATVVDPRNMKATQIPGTRVPLGSGDAISILPYPPQAPAAYAPKPYQIFDTKGVAQGTQWMTPEEGQQFERTNPGFVARPAGFVPRPTQQVAPALRNMITRAKEELAFAQKNISQGIFDRIMGNPPEDSPEVSAAKAKLASAYGQVLAADTTIPPDIKQQAIEIASDPELNGLFSADLENEDGTPLEISDPVALDRALQTLRGVDILPETQN